MLLTQRAYVQGCRALGVWAAKSLDLSKHHPDAAERAKAEDLVALITPIVKALTTDLAFEVTNFGMQVLGGHGYIREHGMEQYVRDCRITQLYEGTNGVQALDLVGRKLPAHAGRHLRAVFHPIADFIESRSADSALAELVAPLAEAFERLQRATAHIARVGTAKPEEAGAAASDYLRLLGLTLLGYLWARMAEISMGQSDDPDGFYRAKAETARFFMQRLLPQTSGLFQAIMAGGGSIMAIDDAAL
jgi:butyryl-CoA dehydrogenase